MNHIFFQNDQILLRKGLAKDSDAIAEFIYSSAPDYFNFIHHNKENALVYIKYEFKKSIPGLFGHTYSWVGEDHQGKVISSAILNGTVDYYLMILGTLVNIIRFYNRTSFDVLKRFVSLGSLVDPPKKGELFLSYFGVSEHLRGKGFGELILKQQMKWAKENGYSIYGLDVAEKNPRAKKLYERVGMKETKHKISPTEKVSNTYKMEIRL